MSFFIYGKYNIEFAFVEDVANHSLWPSIWIAGEFLPKSSLILGLATNALEIICKKSEWNYQNPLNNLLKLLVLGWKWLIIDDFLNDHVHMNDLVHFFLLHYVPGCMLLYQQKKQTLFTIVT